MRSVDNLAAGILLSAGLLLCLPHTAEALDAEVPVRTVSAEHTADRTLRQPAGKRRQAAETEEAVKKAVEAEEGSAANQAPAKEQGEAIMQKFNVRLTWPVYPSAVRYQVVVLRNNDPSSENIVLTKEYVFSNGIDIDLSAFGEQAMDFYWVVCPLTFEGTGMAPFSAPKPIRGQPVNSPAPLVTTEFEKMDYFPLYPVFSWIPYRGSKQHELQVIRHKTSGDEVIFRGIAGETDYYSDSGYTDPGAYSWRVRALSSEGRAVSEWSEPQQFRVTQPVTVAALGDSITHGGGAMCTPPGYTIYNWETYSEVPVKNLGFSGDPTYAMYERFDRDVLPFHPKILVIMGGVNDFRLGTPAQDSIFYLEQMREKCLANDIIPVFATATPVNPVLMDLRGILDSAAEDWKLNQQQLNAWVMSQPYHIDTASTVTDEEGFLLDTSDGLHPNQEGKRRIGKAISDYLLETFPMIVRKRQAVSEN